MIDCVICLQLMKPPVKVLSCGHSFCLRCVRQIRRQNASATTNARRAKLVCPTCRQETPIPRGRTSLLPNNYAVHDILDKQRQERRRTEGESKESNETETKAASSASSVSSLGIPSTSLEDGEIYYDENEYDEWWDDALYENDESEYDSGNWYCPNESCGYYNFSFRNVCRCCRCPRSYATVELYQTEFSPISNNEVTLFSRPQTNSTPGTDNDV